jgi:hypothetical protein
VKALTVRQPYAWAIAAGGKDVENRTRRTTHRGQLAIHAGAAWLRGAGLDQNIIALWAHHFGSVDVDAAYLGQPQWRAVVAVADLYGCHVPSPGCCSSVWAAPDAGAHWLLRDVRRLSVPVPARGLLGLWDLPHDTAAAVARAVLDEETP